MIVVTLVVILLVWLFFKYIQHIWRMESYVKNVKSLSKTLPFIGNVGFFIGKSPQEAFETMNKFCFEKGTPWKMYFGPELVVSLDKPEDMKTILMSANCLDKPYNYDFYPSSSGILNERCKFRINCLSNSIVINKFFRFF